MSPILITTPTFIMSPDLPIMPISFMPSPTTPLAPSPSASENYSRPSPANHAVLILFVSVVSVVGLSALLVCGWLYIKSRKRVDTESASDYGSNETKVWEPGEGVHGKKDKASGIDAVSGDKAFVIGDCDVDSDTSQLGEDDIKNIEHSEKDTPADTETEGMDHPEAFFNSKHFSILGGFDTSFASIDGDDHDIASLFSDEDRASIVSYISDSKRLSSANWAAIKQTVADRTSFVQKSVSKVEQVHIADVSLEAQVVIGYAEITSSTPGKGDPEDESQANGMASLFAEIDAVGELYSSSSESSSNMSEMSAASARTSLAGKSDMETPPSTHLPAVSSSPITLASAHFAHRYSSDFKLSASSLSAPSESSDECMPLPLIRPLNIKKKNPVSSTPAPVARAAKTARGPAELLLFKFPDQASLCQAILEDSLVHPHDATHKHDSGFQEADGAERLDTQFEFIIAPTSPGTPYSSDGSSSRLPALTDDSMSSTSSTYSYEEREREAIANWSSLLHSSPGSERFDPFDTFCTTRSTRAALKGKGRATCQDAQPIPHLLSRFPRSEEDPADITTCSFVFDAFMDSVVDEGEFVNRPSPRVEDKQAPHVVSTEQSDHTTSVSLPIVVEDLGAIHLVAKPDNHTTPGAVTDAPEAASIEHPPLSTSLDTAVIAPHSDDRLDTLCNKPSGEASATGHTLTMVPGTRRLRPRLERRILPSTKENTHATEGKVVPSPSPLSRQLHSAKPSTRPRAQSNAVQPKSQLSTTPVTLGLSPKSTGKRSIALVKHARLAEQVTTSRGTRVDPPRVSSLASKSGSITAAPSQSTPKPASRARSRTIVAQRGPSGVEVPCQQQGDGRIARAGGIVTARQSLTSERPRSGLTLQGFTRRTGSRPGSVSSVPGNAMESPATRTRSRAHDPSSKTPLKTAIASGQSTRSASLVSPSLSGHSARSAALRRNFGAQTSDSGAQPRSTPVLSRSTSVPPSAKSTTSISQPRASFALSRTASVSASSSPPKTASRSTRSPMLSSSPISPRAIRRSKDKEARKPLHTISENMLENSASTFEREKGTRFVMDGQSCRETRSSSTDAATFPSDIGTKHSTTQHTRIVNGRGGRSTSRPTSIRL